MPRQSIGEFGRQIGACDPHYVSPAQRVGKPLDGDEIESERARVLHAQPVRSERAGERACRALDVVDIGSPRAR
jgi:hypothetical protein